MYVLSKTLCGIKLYILERRNIQLLRFVTEKMKTGMNGNVCKHQQEQQNRRLREWTNFLALKLGNCSVHVRAERSACREQPQHS